MTDAHPSLKSELDATLRRVGSSIAKRESAKVYQLPFWPDPQRGIPNELIRSALFSAVRAGATEALSEAPIAAPEGYRIIYTGMKLDQSHLDVFEGVMHIGRGTAQGNRVEFTRRGLLKLIGRCDGKTDHAWLVRVLARLQATSVRVIRQDENLFSESLLPQFAYDADTKRYSVTISRPLAKLFDRGFTRIEWKQRQDLRRKPLAQWLHLYYASHARPYPVTVPFLCEQSGSKTKQLYHFRDALQRALNELVKIGFLTSFTINESDLVTVERAPREALPSPT